MINQSEQFDSPNPQTGNGSVAAVLNRLRTHIRRYSWAEGLTAAVAAVAISFWVSLAIDWLFEPSVGVRIGLLFVVAAAVMAILYRLIISRSMVPLSDRNMAILLERRFEHLNDSVLTAVEMRDEAQGVKANSALLAAVQQEAAEKLSDVDVNDVFDFRPLRRSTFAAVVAVAAVLVYAGGAPQHFKVWARRAIMLSEETWPRQTHLVVEGFEDGYRKVARGSNVEIVVKADTSKKVPEVVELRYVTDEGVRGRQFMQREGEAVAGKEDFQYFTYTFEAVPSGRMLEIAGGDVRLRDLQLEVVDSPTLTELKLDFRYPEYTQLSPSFGNDATGAMQVPRGASIELHAKSNKPLVAVEIKLSGGEVTEEVRQLALEGEQHFDFNIADLDSDRVLLITLSDSDGLRNREPVRLALAAMPDSVPQLSIRPQGIGSAITPLARLPFSGKLTDDYGVNELWFEYLIDGGHPRRANVALSRTNITEAEIQEAFDVRTLELEPGRQLEIRLAAADNHALPPEGSQEGTSETFTLDVVTAEELRAMLESRELNLRRRFESTIESLETTREGLLTLSAASLVSKPADPAESAESEANAIQGNDAQDTAANALSMTMLRVQRAMQNSRMSAGETSGIAKGFEQIGAELQNNRIPDYEELLSRLTDGIASPLHGIAEEMYPTFRTELEALQEVLPNAAGEEIDVAAIDAALAASILKSEEVLAEMRRVLDRMLELETFNELVDLLRSIIDSQEQIAELTKQERKAQLRRLLED